MSNNKVTINVPTPGQNNTYVGVTNGGQYQNNPNATTIINTESRPQAFRITEIINCLDERANEIPEDDDFNLNLYYIDQKVTFNSLNRWADDITEFRPYYGMVNSIYAEFDKQGCNKSRKVLRWLKDRYRRLQQHYEGDELFDQLLDAVCSAVSSDHHLATSVREEDLEYNARIVLVDAFIKCEIFKKPTTIC